MFAGIESGREMLQQLGWDSPWHHQATIAIPTDHGKLFQVTNSCRGLRGYCPTMRLQMPAHVYQGSPARCYHLVKNSFPLPPVQDEWKTVLDLITRLCCKVAERECQPALHSLRNKEPKLFESTGLYLHAAFLLEKLSFRLPTRQFVHNLFRAADLRWD